MCTNQTEQRMKKIINILLLLILTMPVLAKESPVSKGQKLYDKGKYTEAIIEFSKTAKKDKLVLISAYEKRGDKYFNEKEFGKAANDYRSALFYALYFYPEPNTNISQLQKNLKDCEAKLHLKNTAKSHYYTAKLLDIAGEYPASAYEYMQTKNQERAKQIISELEEK